MKIAAVPGLIAFSVLLAAAACSNNKQEPAPAAGIPAAATQAAGQPDNLTPSKIAQETKTDMQALLNPSKANEKAPAAFKAKFKTTKGDFTIEVTRAWAPLGADRFYNLVKAGYFTDLAFFPPSAPNGARRPSRTTKRRNPILKVTSPTPWPAPTPAPPSCS